MDSASSKEKKKNKGGGGVRAVQVSSNVTISKVTVQMRRTVKHINIISNIQKDKTH